MYSGVIGEMWWCVYLFDLMFGVLVNANIFLKIFIKILMSPLQLCSYSGNFVFKTKMGKLFFFLFWQLIE